MDSVKLLWRERQSESSLIESVWTCHALETTSRAVIADPCICISLVKTSTSTEVIIAGPKTRPRSQTLLVGYTCTTIRLKPGVSLKNVHASGLVNDVISIPADDKAEFKFEGVLFKFPDFEHAEQIVEKLFAIGYLNFKQPQNIQMQPRRTYSRQMRRYTGISPYKLRQLQRIHRALHLFKHGVTTADVVTELAFTDQAHFAHSSKQFLGYTPKRLKELLQNP